MQECRHGAYHADVRRFDAESVCQGVKDHQLCNTCARFKPGPRTEAHFLNPPPGNLYTCRCYL